MPNEAIPIAFRALWQRLHNPHAPYADISPHKVLEELIRILVTTDERELPVLSKSLLAFLCILGPSDGATIRYFALGRVEEPPVGSPGLAWGEFDRRCRNAEGEAATTLETLESSGLVLREGALYRLPGP